MLIQFKEPDPRAGMTVRMDSSRGQQLIDAGAADRVAENGDAPRDNLRAELDAALAGLPGENSDPDYVVRAMRSHFGAVFSDADEARVREVVVASAAPEPSDAAPAAAPEPAKPTRSRK
ncbi:hypothetical protein QRO11_12060 [Paracidovorax citrulli]|uniref:hypothetical protein n=1 Tax=Paracidovorax citrulli TaxID=80869 RepID=UPI0005FC30F5|nr:hypothetical protein [Paracidovorax citrulli]UMT88372.1 hypothetical protein FRC90_10015 [Paracidovorax citrulli]WIY32719.1 hypothetical protein QRO11_12060 [Paracidovorax citrulli]SDJ31144.1 hypothetical protein SAMN04489709_10377 [Paracidovorax citrulli]